MVNRGIPNTACASAGDKRWNCHCYHRAVSTAVWGRAERAPAPRMRSAGSGGLSPHRAAPSLATSSSSSSLWGRSLPRAVTACISFLCGTFFASPEYSIQSCTWARRTWLEAALLSCSPMGPQHPLGGSGCGRAGGLSEHGPQVLRRLPALPSCPLRQMLDKLPPGGWPAGEPLHGREPTNSGSAQGSFSHENHPHSGLLGLESLMSRTKVISFQG